MKNMPMLVLQFGAGLCYNLIYIQQNLKHEEALEGRKGLPQNLALW